MIYEGDLTILSQMWEERLRNPELDTSYKDAVKDCLYEMNSFVNAMSEFDEDTQKYLDEQNADAYLSSMESHEVI